MWGRVVMLRARFVALEAEGSEAASKSRALIAEVQEGTLFEGPIGES